LLTGEHPLVPNRHEARESIEREREREREERGRERERDQAVPTVEKISCSFREETIKD
jgi:hypothetical protein